MSIKLYPLKVKKLSGITISKIETYLNFPQKRTCPQEEVIAETREVTAHPDDPGEGANKPLKGKKLRKLMRDFGPLLVGQEFFNRYGEKFPPLLEFLDAKQTPEVQIHPSGDYAKDNGLDEFDKPEVWYVLEAHPDSFLYWGTKELVTKKSYSSEGFSLLIS